MKKIIGIIIFLVIFIVAGFGVLKLLKKDGESIQSVLPAKPIVYVHLEDVSANLEELTSTEIFNALAQIDYEQLLSIANVPRAQREYLNVIFAELTDPTKSVIIKKIFGNELAVAVYGQTIAASQLEIKSLQAAVSLAETVLSNIVIVTRVKKDVQIAEVMSRTFKNFGENISNHVQEYDGLKINVLTEGNYSHVWS